jgi:hypothetical protein
VYEISASVAGAGTDATVICCFDPTMVIVRLKRALPKVEVDPHDHAWRDYEHFQQMADAEGAMRTAERDALRRGPQYLFRFPSPGRAVIFGRAERYDVRIWSDEPIPEPLRSRFLEFLENLRFAPCVSVRSVRISGNDTFPA